MREGPAWQGICVRVQGLVSKKVGIRNRVGNQQYTNLNEMINMCGSCANKALNSDSKGC